MKRILLALALPLLIGSASCGSPHPEEAAVLEALDQTVDALKRSDFDALWAMTDPASQRALLDLLDQLHEAEALLPELLSDEALRSQARDALGAEPFASISSTEERAGPRLLARLLATDRLGRDQAAMDGVNHRDVTVSTSSRPLHAIVHTSGGESFAFVKSERGWRSLLVRDLLLDHLALRELRDNAAKIKAAALERARAWRDSRDPRQPQGAYNIARAAAAASPRDGALLYSMLDAEARAVLVDTLQKAREVQRAIQRHTTRKQRRRAYSEASLSLYVDAQSDRDLYIKWSHGDDWVSPLPTDDPPERVDGDLKTGSVDVITKSGARVPMTRAPDGLWRPSNQAALIAKALRDPLTAQLKR